MVSQTVCVREREKKGKKKKKINWFTYTRAGWNCDARVVRVLLHATCENNRKGKRHEPVRRRKRKKIEKKREKKEGEKGGGEEGRRRSGGSWSIQSRK